MEYDESCQIYVYFEEIRNNRRTTGILLSSDNLNVYIFFVLDCN
jgi:hypothetical protein